MPVSSNGANFQRAGVLGNSKTDACVGPKMKKEFARCRLWWQAIDSGEICRSPTDHS